MIYDSAKNIAQYSALNADLETVYVQHAEQLKEITQPYNSDMDALLGKLSEQATAVILRPGEIF